MLIGDVARRSGVSARMLRHYDSIGLVRPTGRTSSGYREYSADDIRRIFHIESLRSLGLSLKEAGQALDDPAFDPAGLVGELIGRTRERIAAETRLLARLERLGEAGPAGWEEVLQIVALLQALGSDSAGRRQKAALSEVPVPVEALVEAALSEPDTNAAGALRWALVRAGTDALPLLAAGLDAAERPVRRRAIRAIDEFPGPEATAVLRATLTHDDHEIRRYAAVALGSRSAPEAIPTLVDMIVTNTNDAGAADALSALAGDAVLADRIAGVLTERIAGSRNPAARQRLTQALADIPGETATRALTALSAEDADRAVALTAAYVLRLRSPVRPSRFRDDRPE
ncbi:HEAT repeat domain-containing protein [Actinoplanes sp. G11-F43]|uniref:HEAT repeat domain-containing protein n=1 Tax=Actinoplanes sp. G11-F43 TaxID=3424130 RepID=UPI003D340546